MIKILLIATIALYTMCGTVEPEQKPEVKQVSFEIVDITEFWDGYKTDTTFTIDTVISIMDTLYFIEKTITGVRVECKGPECEDMLKILGPQWKR